MAGAHVDRLAGLQLVARGQGFFERGGRVAAVQPVGQQRLLAGVVQARTMTRLRRCALSGPTLLRERVRRGAIIAATLRAVIAVLTVTLVVLGSALAA